MNIIEKTKKQINAIADAKIRVGDAVTVAIVIGTVTVFLLAKRGDLYVSFTSRQKHGV